MIISATPIRRPRRLRWCASCNLPTRFDCVRLYGAAERGDPPYVIYQCLECAERSARDDIKIQKAVAALTATTPDNPEDLHRGASA